MYAHLSIMTSGALRLYTFRRCPFAIRVRIVLHEKNVSFTAVEEDLKNKSAELQRLHPQAKVPLLVHGDFVVFESAVITEYLDATFAGPRLMPESAHDRARVGMWTAWCAELLKVHVDQLKYEQVSAAIPALHDCFARLEARLAQHDWLVGHAFSLADVHVFPFVRQLERVESAAPIFAAYPRTRVWFEHVSARDSVRAAMAKP
jgi:glutathione S-transferase